MSLYRSRSAPKVNPYAQLSSGLKALGLDHSPEMVEALMRYIAVLERWNVAYNLTAIRDIQGMVTRHLLDSLSIAPFVHGRLLDVGSGAGLPGIPLAILKPELQVTVLDSNGKKTRFMRHAQRMLELGNLEVVEARVEAFEAPAYDVIVSRAFATLADFLTATRHLLAPGGQWVAMKGKLDSQELADVSAPFLIRESHRLQVPGLDEERHAVIAGLAP